MRRIENLLLTFAISIASGGCSNTVPEEVPDEPTSSSGSSSGTSTTGVASPDTEDTIADESSASGSASGSSTGEGAESSSSGGPPDPVCGNGRVEADEQCDDGNDSEFDECTTTCTMPSCDDGLHDGAEADVDCGGPCDTPCATCQMCLGNEDCAEPETCNAAGQCTLTQLVQIDWLVRYLQDPKKAVEDWNALKKSKKSGDAPGGK